MTKRIFRSICIAALSVFLVTYALIMGTLYSYFSSVQQNQLKIQTRLAAQGVEQCGSDYFEGLDIGNYRVTWIDSDGTVLYDNKSDSKEMKNHLSREEVQQALKSGYGESSRYSSTIMEKSQYSAQKLSDGTILRLSATHGSIWLLMVGMIQPTLVIIFVAIILSFVLAGRLSKRIVKPLNDLNLEEPLENEGYDELSPLLRRIHSQQKQLKYQEENLRRRQNELEVIVGNMEEGLALLDQKGHIISMNKAARRLLGAEKSSLGSDLLAVSRNLKLQQAVEKAALGEASSVTAVLQGKTIQISVAPVCSDQGISGTAIVFFDITEKENAEQQRREFTANVSHELKTPLHSISGYSELIKRGMVPEKDVQPFAEKIYNEAQRLIQLVEDIMKLSHLDESGMEMERVPVDLYQMAGEVAKSLTPAAEEKGVTISLSGTPAEMCGIQEMVHGIVYNLCDNAVKYNREGGEVLISVEKKPEEILFTVKDTGIGIPQEDQDRIFERFYRVDKSRSKEVGGTGLGLSIVKHAVQIHNAKIEVNSKVDVGTEICVRFPVTIK